MPADIRITPVTGAALSRHIPDLARLRIQVFRDWPYLYDGDPDYEAHYLATYSQAPGSVVVLAEAAGQVIGAATAVPLAAETDEVRAPFIAAGTDPAGVFYLGESVLLPAWRGRGVGVRFFAEREAHARRIEAAHGPWQWFAFCAVQRDPADPRRPADYRPLDDFWRHRGYARRADLTTAFTWRELGEGSATPKPMGFWLKAAGSSGT